MQFLSVRSRPAVISACCIAGQNATMFNHDVCSLDSDERTRHISSTVENRLIRAILLDRGEHTNLRQQDGASTGALLSLVTKVLLWEGPGYHRPCIAGLGASRPTRGCVSTRCLSWSTTRSQTRRCLLRRKPMQEVENGLASGSSRHDRGATAVGVCGAATQGCRDDFLRDRRGRMIGVCEVYEEREPFQARLGVHLFDRALQPATLR